MLCLINHPQQTSNINTKCTPVQYVNNHSVCYTVLQQYKTCIPTLSTSSNVYVSSNINIEESENAIIQLLSLQKTLSPNCQVAVVPFICLYLFPLCDENQTAYLPSSQECNSISTDICKAEWSMAQQLLSSLPNCAALPNVTHCNCKLQLLFVE